ncbi:MAG TPA: coenzyme F420-0:L-glutamate ligase [Dehalococcoidia bacterium]|nr:coenzyme F420-0:L-glutamate ligase [Dehalococcoidia bacterium]
MTPPEVRIIGVRGIPMVQAGDDLAKLIFEAAQAQETPLEAGDVIVVTQRVVSKAEGRVVPLDDFEPTPFAREWAARTGKDARQIEAVLRESVRVVRQARGVLITETKHGFICANAGVDASNVGGDDLVSLLPEDPDGSCRILRDAIRERTGLEVAVVMTDTFGRPWREGQTNIAIGLAGMRPLHSYEGVADLDGRELRVTMPCPADEIAAAAGLVMEKLAAIPVAIVRGFPYEAGEGSAREIVRPFERDLFP